MAARSCCDLHPGSRSEWNAETMAGERIAAAYNVVDICSQININVAGQWVALHAAANCWYIPFTSLSLSLSLLVSSCLQ